MPPHHHRSRPSRRESPHREPLSSTPSRSKYTFPVVNTPVLRRSRHNSENLPPDSALNFKASSPFSDANTSSPALSKSSSKSKHNGNASLPPRPPSSKPSPATSHRTTGNGSQETQGNAKRKLNLEAPAVHTEPVVLTNTCQSALQEQDSGVKVIIRVRPCNHKEDLEEATQIVERNSCDSLSLGEQHFTFDHVAGTDASQQTMFEIVGLPLVENCLQGFNSSIFAYGQTGSGKTYTMWGATQDLTAAQPPSEERGLTPRVFERLFQRIKEEETKNTDKQLHYQCRCSFLEVYNEQITDLLEPQQKALQVREDIKAGVYVENLTEEYVSNYDEVFCLVLKGLGNRKVGSTSMNLESSRSHTLFTCVIESRCKSISDGVSSVRTSRMNLVDLAGSERRKLTGAAGERLKEAGNINRSLSQLGNLINILAEVSQSGKPRHIPYRDSKLTFLLQELLGGNAKLAMICAISSASSCKSETLSTLRFAQRAKAIKNKAVVNEETENDVNLLREQIRQLKDELMRMKSNVSQPGGIGGYSTTWNARRSYNLLRMSLISRPLTLPHTDSDTDEEMEIDEDAVESVDGLNPSTSEGESTHLALDAPQDPILSVSPRIQDDDEHMAADSIGQSSLKDKLKRKALLGRSSLPSGKTLSSPTDRLAESLHQGLQILENHQKKVVNSQTSVVQFSFQNLQLDESKPIVVDKSMQTSPMCSPEKGLVPVSKVQHLDITEQAADEMKEALQMAMEGHARLLEQYAELQEKHISLLAKHRKIRDGMVDARKKAGKLGFLGAKWLEAQAAELVALKLEHEHERKMAKEQIEGLQAQVRDTADAVQAAGELLVRLKEAEEAVLIAQDAAALAEQDADKLHREIEKLKRRHLTEIATLQQRLMEARLQKSTGCPMCAMAECVKFQFVEVDAEEHEAALEAEHVAAEAAAAAASAASAFSSMPFHKWEDGYLGMLREEGEGDDDQVQVHAEEHFLDVEEEFNLGHSRVLEMDDRWYEGGQITEYLQKTSYSLNQQEIILVI